MFANWISFENHNLPPICDFLTDDKDRCDEPCYRTFTVPLHIEESLTGSYASPVSEQGLSKEILEAFPFLVDLNGKTGRETLEILEQHPELKLLHSWAWLYPDGVWRIYKWPI